MAKAKTKGTTLTVPQNDADAEQLLARIGAIDRDLAAEKARHDGVVAVSEELYATMKKKLEAERKAAFGGLAMWAAVHRERLTNGGRTKTVQLVTGKIEWRDEGPSVKIDGKAASKTGKEIVPLVMARLSELASQAASLARRERAACEQQQQGLRSFLRTSVTLNKLAMHANRALAETLPGITIEASDETFDVLPLASQIREVA